MIKFGRYKKSKPRFVTISEKTGEIKDLVHSLGQQYVASWGYFSLGLIRRSDGEDWKSVIVGNFEDTLRLWGGDYNSNYFPKVPVSGDFFAATFISESGMKTFLEKTGRISIETFNLLRKQGLAKYYNRIFTRAVNFMNCVYD